jgi:phosphoglycolate phosphatase-like HAD superfamily hydrolase
VRNTAAHRLVLWDIDLTLVELRGLGGRWYREVLQSVTGAELGAMPVFAGRTERAITGEILTAHGIEPTEDVVQRMWTELVTLSRRTVPTLPRLGRALPGAAAALSTLAGHDGVVQSLVTGNLPEIALHKLSAFELHEHVDFDIGGYGSLSVHRPELVGHAVERAGRKHATTFASDAVVVIGDTPHDIESALAHGATAVGVATGRHSAAQLAEAGAHTVLPDLADTGAVLRTLLGNR